MVKEFYANLYNPEGPCPKQVKIRGHLIKIDAGNLNTFLETPMVLAEGESYPLTPDTAGCPLISERLRLLCVYPAEGLF